MICIDVILRSENIECIDNPVNYNIHITDRGEDGRTPIKGEDYWTEKDIEEIKREIIFDNDFEEITTKDIDLLF